MELLIGFLVFGVACMILHAVFGPLVEGIRRQRRTNRLNRREAEFQAHRGPRSRSNSGAV